MTMEFIGDTLTVLGEILIAITVIAVHDIVIKEKKVDELVTKTIRKEHVFGFLGISFLIIGFVLSQLGKASL